MCYSAMVWEDYRSFVRHTGATIDIKEFVRLFGIRNGGAPITIPKGIEAPFLNPDGEDELLIATMIAEYRNAQAVRIDADMEAQRERLSRAEHVLATKPTKKAAEDKRIATKKLSEGASRLADLRRAEPRSRDSRIFPGSYALVMVSDGGRRVVRPMRYQCRIAGKPKHYDKTYPGTYNARRDNLEGFWRDAFGKTHGIVLVDRFYENVERIGDDGKLQNVVLEFTPNTGEPMYAACLWSRWTDDTEDLLSFALITDDPPPEVLAAGHDRCIIPIKPEYVDVWLNPDTADLAAQYAILADRERPFYEHKVAA